MLTHRRTQLSHGVHPLHMCRVTGSANLEHFLNWQPSGARDLLHLNCVIEEFHGRFGVCGGQHKLAAIFLRIACVLSPAPTSASTCVGVILGCWLCVVHFFCLLFKYDAKTCLTSKRRTQHVCRGVKHLWSVSGCILEESFEKVAPLGIHWGRP